MRRISALMIVAGLTLAACEFEDTTSTPTEDPSTVMTEETEETVAAPPLWTEADDEVTLLCTAENGLHEAEMKLPPRSTITDDLNSLLYDHDGRPPLTAVTVVDTSALFPKVDETGYLRRITFSTPDGDVVLERFSDANDPEMLLYEERLTGWKSRNAPQELKDRGKAIQDALYNQEPKGVVQFGDEYRGQRAIVFVTDMALTHINKVTVSWGTLGGGADCVIK